MSVPKIIGICGGSASGKTTLANALQKSLGEHQCTLIGMDSYYKDRSGMDTSQMNFDAPASFDLHLLVKDIQQLKKGQGITVPRYDYSTHSRKKGGFPIKPTSLILLDGLFLFTLKDINALLNYRVFVDTPAAVRLVRRINRDVRERGRSVQDIIGQYLETVAPMHAQYVKPNKPIADLVISGGSSIECGLESLHSAIQGQFGKPIDI